MIAIGLDIGTTTVSAVAIREDGRVLAARTLKNDAAMPGAAVWERIQDPKRILALAHGAVTELLELYPDAASLGVTGQMHGIVYLDAGGNPVSPLYTWQDGRGDLTEAGGRTYVQHLSQLTGYPMSTGFGLATHYYQVRNGLVPKEAVTFCTIADYAAMVLAGNLTPLLDASNAASLGLFSLEERRFDCTALKKAGLDAAMLPALTDEPRLGTGPLGLPVSVAIGDNQASYLGAAPGSTSHILVNVGTGSQFSARISRLTSCPGLEHRPFPLGGYLLVGSSLCGGCSYALLEQFFRQTAEMVTGTHIVSCYDAMEKLLDAGAETDDLPIVHTVFQGTRENPSLRGSIQGLSVDNLMPRSLTLGFLHGMTDELYGMYARYRDAAGQTGASTLIGSGNGLRRNPHLRRIIARRFGLPLGLSKNEEEAACGAALFALTRFRQ